MAMISAGESLADGWAAGTAVSVGKGERISKRSIRFLLGGELMVGDSEIRESRLTPGPVLLKPLVGPFLLFLYFFR